MIENIFSTAKVLSPEELTEELTKKQSEKFFKNLKYIYVVVSYMIIFVFGIIGNLLCIVVFGSKAKKGPSNITMIFLAVGDISVLITNVGYFIIEDMIDEYKDIDLEEEYPTFCVVKNWFEFSSQYFATWVLVFLAVERMLAVLYPMKYRDIMRSSTAIKGNILLLLMCLLANLHMLFVYDYNTCEPLAEHYEGIKLIFPIFSLTFSVALPCIIFIVCGITIVLLLRKRRAGVGKESTAGNSADQQSRSITVMLLGTTVYFFITNLPMVVFFIMSPNFWINFAVNRSKGLEYFLGFVFKSIRYTNNSVNILIYFWSSRYFREDLLALFGGGKKKVPTGNQYSDVKNCQLTFALN